MSDATPGASAGTAQTERVREAERATGWTVRRLLDGGRSCRRGALVGYVSRCSIPCFETFPRVTSETSFSFIHPGLSSGALSCQAHAS